MENNRYIEVPLDLFDTANALQCPPTVRLSLFSQPRPREPRAMDADLGVDAALDLPDDIIEEVARANTARVDSVHVLPQVRASQCPFHSKRPPVPPQHLHTTTHHAGVAPISPRKISLLTQQRLVQEMKARLEMEDRRKREETMHNAPMYRRQTLPETMASREFVMSWLCHGTDPSTDTHFPDIVRGKKTCSKSRKTITTVSKKSFLSE